MYLAFLRSIARLSLPVLLLAAAAASQAAPTTPAPVIRVGVQSALHRDADFAFWGATLARIREALPGAQVQLVPLDPAALRRAAASGDLSFLILNAALYVELEDRGLRALAALKTPYADSPDRSVAAVVFTRADRSAIGTLADLRGQRVAAAGADAFGGWQAAWHALRETGIEPSRDLASLQFRDTATSSPVHAVLAGDADAGVVRACVLEQLESSGLIEPGQLKVISPRHGDGLACRHSTPAYSDWLFVATESTPAALVHRVSAALLTMRPHELYEWSMPGDLRPVGKLLADLRIGPYASPPRIDLRELAITHVEWVIAALVFTLGGVVHVSLAQRLVNRRNRQLREALSECDQLEERRCEQQERIDHLARLGILGEISSMIAHEINQPLAAIGGFARGLERRLAAGADPASLAPIAADIARQSERAGEIVAGIRAFARKRAPARLPVDLREVARDAIAMFSAAAARGIRVREGGPAMVEGDRIQLQQVTLNLIKNSLDAARAADVEPAIHLAIDADGQSCRLTVADNGAPLADEAFEQFFEPFFTTKTEGLGLGLAISRGIIEAHGGRMFVRRASAGGLVVGFELPLRNESR